MRKQVRGYFRKTLCGMLSAAMIATSLIVPNMTVYAAPQDEASITTENEEDKLVDESTGEGETGDENQGSGLEGDDRNVDDKDSEKDGESGDIADEDDKENADDEAGENPDDDQDDLTDDEGDGEDEDLKSEEEDSKPVTKKAAVSVMTTENETKTVTLYFYSEALKNYKDSETTKYHLYMSTWNKDKIAADTDEIQLVQEQEKKEDNWNYTAYMFDEVKEHANWYSIRVKPINANDGAEKDGFIIQTGKEVTEGEGETKTTTHTALESNTGLIKLSAWDNKDIYSDLVSLEDEGEIAIRDGKKYAKDQISLIMRQVTLHVYDDKGTPSIAYNAKDTEQKLIPLSCFNDGKKEDLTATATESWAYRYDFSADEGKTNWYHLTFIVPESIYADTIQLYTKDSAGKYDWLVNFTEENFAYVIDGKVYYTGGKTGTFVDAIEDETQTNGDITFYYYLEDAAANEEVGLYCKDNKVTTTATAADWKVNTNDTVYLLKAVTGYAGWYSIPIHVEDTEQASGFAIYVRSASGTPKVEYSKTVNGETYAEIVGGENKTCAYKKGISYIGTDVIETTKVDKVAAIMRNVTVNVYSEDVIPVIQLDNKSAAKVLYKVDETDGSISSIKPSGEDNATDKNPVYDMERIQDTENWYSLSFSVPGEISFQKGAKICGLFEKTEKGEYAWLRNLINGEGDSWGENFTPVFSFDGEVWCKYEHSAVDTERKLSFYATQEEAEAVTLGQLRKLLDSDEIKKIEKKGESGYTKDSWEHFSEVKIWAEEKISEHADEADDFKDDNGITKLYRELKGAMDAMVSLSIDVTFYYYAGDMEEGEEIGLYHWGADLTSEATPASWSVWGDKDTYSMTAVEGYAGWYSLPISFTNSGKNAGFQIFKKSVALSEKDADKVAEYICEASKGDKEFFGKVTSGDAAEYAVKNGKGYAGSMAASIMRQVTLHVYNAEKTPYLHMGKAAATSLSVVNEETGELTPLKDPATVTEEGYDSNAYALQQDEEHKNWYSLTFTAPGKLTFDKSEKIFNLYVKDSSDNYAWVKDFVNGAPEGENAGWQDDFTPVFAGKTYYKDGKFYATMEEADPDAGLTLLDKLQKLVDEAKKYKKEDYKEKGWKTFADALAAAEAVIKAADDAKNDETGTKTAPTDDEIQKAYDDLEAAMKALIPASVLQADINVQKVALADDFITGADLSSYISLRDSGTVFKDEKGNPLSNAEFFRYLKDGGTNWVRIRIWNDPYDGSGRGYGGGNNDLEKAKTIGKLATDAGMKVLIDFHYSDFWADPGKQQAPKAWKAFSLAEKEAAVESYTLSSLNALRDAGVNVGMVQVGNETNNAICGETSRENMAKIFNAGSKAVRAFDPACLVALHFTNPEKGGFQAGWAADLEKNKVDYDVFATSYYPFWHGTTGDLEGVLQYIAETYNKKVMVAETSWTTSWDDGDGHENTAPRTSQALNYDISLQGQADEIRDVVNAVNKVNDAAPGQAIGVFYWEPAWISPYYVYDEDGNADEKLVSQNQEAWEKYGSGWASKYASEYDPDDAGKWYGGSAVDNQAWFDFDGTALATAKVYSLIRTGATAERAISSIGFAKNENPLEVPLGGDLTYPKAVATYNDGTVERLDVQWDQEEQEVVNTDKVGEYVVHGTVTEGGKVYKLTLTIKVMRTSSANILQDPGFEKGILHPDWDLSGATDCVSSKEKDWKENPRSGTYAMNFWSEDPAEFSVSQTVVPEEGSYTFGAYIQGDGAGTDDVHYAFVEVSGKDGKLKFRRQAAFTLNGWRNWVNPEITGVEVEKGDSVKVGVTIKATETGTSGVWGSLDDFYLYGTHSVSIADGIEHGSVETSVIKANSGEKVIVTVTPDEGYYLDTMTLSGASITAENCANILTSANGTVAFRAASGENTTSAAVLTYAAETAEAKSDTFTMPNGNVIVSATFKSIFGESAEKIDLNAKDAAGNYLVLVNAEESDSPAGENPVPAQFHTGKNVTPVVELSYKGYKLTTADYTVAYANNKNITTPESKAKITLTAKGDKFTGTREILFEIKEDTRNEFSAKKLKVVFEASDKNGRTDKPAQAVYYLGKEKEILPKISLYNVADAITDTAKAIDPTLYTVYYQDNKKIGKATLVVLPTDKALNDPNGYKEGSITANFTIAKCPVNQDGVEVSISTAPNYYTGKKVEPSVTVTYKYKGQNGVEKTVTLAKGTDYTVTCTNDVNASVYKTKDADGTVKYEPINANKVPTIKISGKGNFTGVRTTVDLQANGKAGTNKLTFQIRPRELSNTTVTAADLAESTKEQAPKITVKDGTKAVAASQYEITEIKRTHDADGNALAADQVETVYTKGGTGAAKVKQSGTYAVKIAGKEKTNYAGEAAVSFCVVDKDYLISNAKITVSGKFYYTGNQVKLTTAGDTPNLKVSCGKAAQLTEQGSASSGQDGYYVRYTNNTNAGRATITIIGTGKYKGSKTATFTINKRTLTDKITKDSDKGLKGTLQPVKMSKKTIETKQDGVWTPSTENSGLLINSDNTTKTEYGSLAIPYTGYTLDPEFRFSSENYDAAQTPVLNELSSSDYTVTYAIGKWTNDGKAPVTATIKGKGNYSGSVKLPDLFTVTARNLKDFSIDVTPVTYNGKALKPAVIFRDQKGKVVDLKLNTAYSLSYKNNKDIMGVSKKQPTLTVKVKGKGWITDNADPDTKSRTLKFTIDQAEITKADIEDVKFQSFLGKALKPKVTVKVNGRKLKEGKDYTLTYSKNVKRGGAATVKITGKGNYFTRKPIEKTFVIK